MSEDPTYEDLKKRVHDLEQIIEKQDEALSALSDVESILAFFYQNAPFAYQSLDENGHIIDVNNAWVEILGYERDEVIGKSFGDFLHSESIDHFKENFPRFKAIGEILGVEFEMVNKIGETVTVSFKGMAEKDSEGEFKRTHCYFQDISSLKQTKEAFQESEETARALLNASTESAFLIDLDGTFLDMNEVAAARLGKSVDELIGKCSFDMIPSELAKTRRKWGEEVARKKKPIRAVDRRADYILDNNIYPVIDSSGNVHRIAVFSRDISHQKQAEEKLRESMEKFRSLVELTSDWIWEVDEKGTYTYANPKVEDLLGYRPEDLIGKKMPFDLMSPDEAESVGELFKAAATSHEPIQGIENICIHKDGHPVILDTSGVPFFNKAGDLMGYRGIDRDITDRNRIEKALKESERKHKALINNIPGMVYSASSDWSAHVFKGSEEISGYSAADLNLKEKKWLDLIYHEDIEWVFKEGAEIAKIPKKLTQTYRIIDKWGKIRWVEDHKASLVSDKGEFLGIDGIVFDITERKQAEREREKLIKELREALKEIKALRGILPLCSYCKKIRDDKGYWEQVDVYILKYSQADVSHSICPDCAKIHFPEMGIY